MYSGMLAASPVSPLGNNNKNEKDGEMGGFSIEGDEFPDFSIDFDELFMAGISDGDVLPDLEMDSEILAEFSVSGAEDSEMINFRSASSVEEQNNLSKDDEGAAGASVSGSSSLVQGDEIVSAREEEPAAEVSANCLKEAGKGRKSSAQAKNPPGKRKAKVDWTPELHRRFEQAVEQLGLDKAVPSRILELMGIDCLTRHNIASHLQKYRSHRKHLLAREAEAATWSQRRHMYGAAAAGRGGGKREVSPWIAPTMGFPPVTPMPPHFRPLYVRGHPSVDQSLMHVWPKYLAPPPPHAWCPAQPHPPPPPPHAWPLTQPQPPPTAIDRSYWHSHHQYRFFPPPVPGIPTAMYKVDPGHGPPTVPPSAGQTLPRPPSFVHPTKESIDAAIGDVLKKPWLPLPLGLKPPSIDSVVVELQRQGISKIPPPPCT